MEDTAEELEYSEEEMKMIEEGEEEVLTEEETPAEEKLEEVPSEEPPTEEVKGKDTPEEQIDKLTKALNAERAERRQLSTKVGAIDDLKEAVMRLREEKLKTPEEPVPDYEEDPLGHMQHKLKEYDSELGSAKDQISQQQEVNKHLQLAQQVNAMESSFRATHPDYDDAMNHLRETRKDELTLFGITDEQQIEAELQSNARNIAMVAMQQGKNPAELIYQLATRAGYKATKAPSNTGETTLETVLKGQETASQTLSKGGEAEKGNTMDALLNADGETFDKMWEDIFK
jgi:hypothetical protein